MAWYEMIYGTFFEPAETLKRISHEKQLGYGLAVVIVVYIFGFLFDLGMLRSSLPQIQELTSLSINASNSYWFYGLIGLPVAILSWFIMSSIYAMLGSLICNRQNPEGIMSALAFSTLPALLSPPLQLIGRSFAWSAFPLFVGTGIMIWIVVLQVIGLREALEVDSGQAMAVWFVPLAVVFVVIIFFFLGMVGIFSQLLA